VVIHGYPVPVGYNFSFCNLALQVPEAYPTAELDMFYVHPDLSLQSGRTIAAAQNRQMIDGVSYQRWSRHRPKGQWSAARDGVASQLALVDSSLEREVTP
jgi:hypothetical protein